VVVAGGWLLPSSDPDLRLLDKIIEEERGMGFMILNAAGERVLPGETVIDFRGDPAKLIKAVRGQAPGYSGKVLVEWPKDGWRQVYYDKVFDLVVHWMPDVPADFPVQPVTSAIPEQPYTVATCGTCGRSWDDALVTSYTPAPAARCPFEAFHPLDLL